MMRIERFENVTLYEGRCEELLPSLDSGSIDCVLTDPPYPEISRDYGRMTEPQWHALMDIVVNESRRVLKPTGSAVYILQPNSERVGRMRPWLWEFMAKWTREWGMVQDAWWWNFNAIPEAHSIQGRLMRPSLKACVWLGSPCCYRDQESVLWDEAQGTVAKRNAERAKGRENRRDNSPGGQGVNTLTKFNAAERRGGVSPFNVLPVSNGNSQTSAGAFGHGAGTPSQLCDWWLRYICPPGGTVLDTFVGSGTVALAAIKQGKKAIGIEKEAKYFDITCRRIENALNEQPLLSGNG